MYKVRLLAGESILKKGMASMSVEDNTVLGTLCLTTERLIFVGYGRRLFIVTVAEEIPLEHIDSLKAGKTLKLFANAIDLTTIRGRKFTFVLSDRDRWLEAIKHQTEKI